MSHRLLSFWIGVWSLWCVSRGLGRPTPRERSTRIRGADIIAGCACQELPCPGCIRMGRVELALGSSPPFGEREPSRLIWLSRATGCSSAMQRAMEPRWCRFHCGGGCSYPFIEVHVFLHSFICFFIQGFRELGGPWYLFVLGTLTRCKGGVCDTLVGPLGRYVGASESCHNWWSLELSRSGCNSIKTMLLWDCTIRFLW